MADWTERWVSEKYRGRTADIRMIAVKAEVPGGKWKHPSFAFRYVGSRRVPEQVEED